MTSSRRRTSVSFRTDGDLYFTYMLARELGKTVEELLSGRSQPLTHREWLRWLAFFSVEADLKREAMRKNR